MKIEDLYGNLPIVAELKSKEVLEISATDMIERINDEAVKALEEKENVVTSEIFREAERVILLTTVDSKWMDHIDAMDQLRTSVGMRGVGQHDPVVEYKMESSQMFDEMNDSIQDDAVRLLMKGEFSAEKRVTTKSAVRNLSEGHGKEVSNASQIPPEAKQAQGAQASDNAPLQPVKRDAKKVGRNDLCPCGSGKKYKNCCGKNE